KAVGRKLASSGALFFCLLLSAYCFLFSELVFILVIVQVFFFDDVQLYWIQPDYFQVRTTFFTRDEFAFVCVRIYMDIRITFGTCSNRHFVTSAKSFASDFGRRNLPATAA